MNVISYFLLIALVSLVSAAFPPSPTDIHISCNYPVNRTRENCVIVQYIITDCIAIDTSSQPNCPCAVYNNFLMGFTDLVIPQPNPAFAASIHAIQYWILQSTPILTFGLILNFTILNINEKVTYDSALTMEGIIYNPSTITGATEFVMNGNGSSPILDNIYQCPGCDEIANELKDSVPLCPTLLSLIGGIHTQGTGLTLSSGNVATSPYAIFNIPGMGTSFLDCDPSVSHTQCPGLIPGPGNILSAARRHRSAPLKKNLVNGKRLP
jgi:hypothetical protein